MIKNLNKKGSAMVVVLIAVTFISIIASSLLYMSYINLMTKEARISSSDNFYSDELAVAEIATGLQLVAKNGDSPDAAIQELVDNFSDGSGTKYDCTKLQDLVQVANSGTGVTVKVTSTSVGSTNVIQRSGENIVFKDVVIITEDASGYKDRIETDITLDMRTTVKDGPDINDFSIISDATVATTYGNPYGGALILTGNVYCRANPSSSVAMELVGGRVVSMLSPLAAIDGDLKIADHAAMIIAGNCVVDGDVIIGDDSSLIVTGMLGCSGSVDGCTDAGNFSDSSKLKIKGVENIKIDSTKYVLPDSGMAQELFSKNILVNFNGNVTDLGVACRTVPSMNFTEPIDYITNDAQHFKCFDNEQYKVYCMGENNTNAANPYKDVYYGAWVDDPSDTINADLDHYGKLYLTGNDYNGNSIADPNKIQLKELLFGTTILALRDVYFTETHYTKIDKMPDDAYLRAQECMLQVERQFRLGNDYVNNVKFNGGNSANINVESMRQAMRDIKAGGSGHVYQYTVERPVDPSASPSPAPAGPYLGAPEIMYTELTGDEITDEVINFRVDDKVRYMVTTGDNVTYVPVGYLLSPYSKETIAKYFESVYNADSEVSPVLNFKNWDKSNTYSDTE